MSLFRRRRADDADAESTDTAAVDQDTDTDDDLDAAPEAADIEVTAAADTDGEELEYGPYDIDEAPDDEFERLDLGSLKVPALAGVEVQIQANEQGEVAAVALIAGSSAVQLGVFAAPRTEGIWDEVRAELVESLAAEGGEITEGQGEYGVELRGRVTTPNGPQDIRFVGVDGPRWFVRAVFHGEVASDPSSAPELARTLRNVIVERGNEAMPVREPLPLQLPAEALEQQQAAAESAADADADSAEPAAEAGVNGRKSSGGR